MSSYSIYLIAVLSSMIPAVIASFGGIASYILSGIGYMKAAKKEGLKYPWLSWIPVVRYYLIGAVSDKIDEQNGKVKNRRTLLLVLDIVEVVVSLIIVVVCFGFIFNMFMNIFSMIQSETVDQMMIVNMFVPYIGIIILVTLLLSVVSILILVFMYICTYNMFKKYDPKNAGVFIGVSIGCLLVLSAGFVLPIFLLVALNNAEKTQPAQYQALQQ